MRRRKAVLPAARQQQWWHHAEGTKAQAGEMPMKAGVRFGLGQAW